MPVRMKINKPIQSSPTEDARMSVMMASRARFPDAFVRLVPVAANVISKRAEHPSRLSIQNATGADEVSHRIDDFAINVKLQLVDSGVADPNRNR